MTCLGPRTAPGHSRASPSAKRSARRRPRPRARSSPCRRSRLAVQSLAQPVAQIPAVVVVLVEHGDSAPGQVALRCSGRTASPRRRSSGGRPSSTGEPSCRGGSCARPCRRRAAALGRVQIRAHLEHVLGAERVEDREHMVLLHELPRRLRGLRRVVRVVHDLVVDLAPEDAAVRVDVGEVRLGSSCHRRVVVALRHRSERRCRRS